MDYKELKKQNGQRIESYRAADDGGVDFFPKYMHIEMSNRCNANCIICNHFYLDNKGASDISDTIMNRLDSILPYCETVMLNGDGEPFLCSHIIKIIDTLVGYDIQIGTNTNLSYIPEKMWDILEHNFRFLNISCDGATKNTYELIRRGLSYSKFIANLERLNRLAPNLKKNFDCVVMKQNIKELPLIVELASQYGVSCVKFQRLGINPCIGNDSDSPELYFSLLCEMLDKAIEVGRKCGIEVKCPNFSKKGDFLLDVGVFESEITCRLEQSRKKYGCLSLADDYYSEMVEESDFTKEQWYAGKACQWAIERCYIDLKGNITTCCYNMKKYMGNLLDTTFEDIWNGEQYRTLRKLMVEKKLPNFCKQCNWIKEAEF